MSTGVRQSEDVIERRYGAGSCRDRSRYRRSSSRYRTHGLRNFSDVAHEGPTHLLRTVGRFAGTASVG